MAGYTSFADLELGSSVRGKINTQFTELFGENTKATVSVATAIARAAIPAEYLSVGKIVHQVDTHTDYAWNGASWVVHVRSGGQFYGECYLYGNATPMAIDITNTYHACPNSLEGLTNGFTYKDGAVIAISGVTSASGGTKITCTSVAHGLLDGEVITITNSTNYDGVYLVESKTDDTFVVTKAYVASRTFNACRGFSLRANTGTAGTFILDWNCSAKNASGTNKDWRIEANLNLVALDKASSQVRLPSATETSALAAGCILTVAAGDYIWISVKNLTDAVDITIVDANLRIRRI
jgi:hypothetical protein